jgi:hypothetical protein
MPPKALLLLHILADAEPVLTIAALAAFLRVRRQVDLPAMRDYLIVRATWAVLIMAPLLAPPSQLQTDTYFYLFWAGSFLLAALLLRVALAALDRFLWAFPGLKSLRRIGFLWLLFVAALLTIPLVAALLGAIYYHRAAQGDLLSLRLNGAITLTEFLAATSVVAVGLRSGLPTRSRLFGILAGFALESGTLFLSSQLGSPRLWSWHNLIGQIATDSTLILWIVYLLLPDRQGPMNEPSERVLRWDQTARWIFRDRLAASGQDTNPEQRKGKTRTP